MRDAPPPASLKPARGEEWWVCYYCEQLLMPAAFQLLGQREVRACEYCGRIQVFGKDEEIRKAALAADAAQPKVGARDGAANVAAGTTGAHEMRRLTRALERSSLGATTLGAAFGRKAKRDLPHGMSEATRQRIETARDYLKKKHGKAPKTKVAAQARCSPNTVDKYWPYLRNANR